MTQVIQETGRGTPAPSTLLSDLDRSALRTYLLAARGEALVIVRSHADGENLYVLGKGQEALSLTARALRAFEQGDVEEAFFVADQARRLLANALRDII